MQELSPLFQGSLHRMTKLPVIQYNGEIGIEESYTYHFFLKESGIEESVYTMQLSI